MRSARAEPCIFIMFGATGDLMRRKLLPALYNLAEEKLLPPGFQILGVARDAKLTEAQFRKLGRSVLADAGYATAARIRAINAPIASGRVFSAVRFTINRLVT